jgi:predicted RNA-binding protein with PUA-like domain
MAYWLFKSEPFKWSWDQQVAAGEAGTHWDGVRNHLAKQQMMAMKTGDQGFFYHSNEGKEIVGIVEVIREAFPDPTAEPDEPWIVVQLKAVEPFTRPVSLAEIKTIPELQDMALLKMSRLSVQPVKDDEWDVICALGL